MLWHTTTIDGGKWWTAQHVAAPTTHCSVKGEIRSRIYVYIRLCIYSCCWLVQPVIPKSSNFVKIIYAILLFIHSSFFGLIEHQIKGMELACIIAIYIYRSLFKRPLDKLAMCTDLTCLEMYSHNERPRAFFGVADSAESLVSDQPYLRTSPRNTSLHN